jgi:hypothetical protein
MDRDVKTMDCEKQCQQQHGEIIYILDSTGTS